MSLLASIDTGDSRSFPAAHALHRRARRRRATWSSSSAPTSARALAGIGDREQQDRRRARARHRMPRRAHGRSARHGRLERARLRALPARRRPSRRSSSSWCASRSTAHAALAAAKTGVRGRRPRRWRCAATFPGASSTGWSGPTYNAALRRLDEGLATADDMDTTLKLGLGYPEGPIALLERTGLAAHFDVTQALYEALRRRGLRAGAPRARRQRTLRAHSPPLAVSWPLASSRPLVVS